ncbi:MAG TPA: hypothetical protein VIV60_12695 [Polyangiaceae bacterium]
MSSAISGAAGGPFLDVVDILCLTTVGRLLVEKWRLLVFSGVGFHD